MPRSDWRGERGARRTSNRRPAGLVHRAPAEQLQTGVRGGDPKDTFGKQMAPMAMTLATDQDVADVAAYVETLK
ncbi:hypothetical protein AUC68_11625 [Methyloceanibacter methanicus]|uniref:Cytochrome c domain-containing protein n=1 Tax=Methyloceanibacter methanicus TaxID=1774968 RepID=A0A1E3W5J5_9HYPH|nr:c-type cytochrome [Methyloceanibacter methanicus]ODS01036.1 hypothetical protein AUC68_11625 [Methyloceanibacter methanicus]